MRHRKPPSHKHVPHVIMRGSGPGGGGRRAGEEGE
jgi:hypothetical protein